MSKLIKLLRTPKIFIDWILYQKQLKDTPIAMPEFSMYWRLHL